jgi:hypothetical protein
MVKIIRKNKNNKKGKGNRNNDVTIRSCFHDTQGVATNTAVKNLGPISTNNSDGILLGDVNVQSLTDIFRLVRINEIKFTFGPSSGAGTAAVEVPAGFLGFVPFGVNTNPTAFTDFETPLVSEPTVPFGTSTTTTAPLTRECTTTLALRNKDMPVLQGPGGGWLATQNDGTQTSWGTLFWALASATAANTVQYLLTTHFDISWKDLLDPTLISKLMSRHPAGLPDHFEISEGSALHLANDFQVSKFAIQSQIPPALMPAVQESDLDRLKRQIEQMRLQK